MSQFFHGTDVALGVGAVILPGAEVGRANYDYAEHGYANDRVFITTDENAAWTYAKSRTGHRSTGYVYRVEPIGEPVLDPRPGGWGQQTEYSAPAARVVEVMRRLVIPRELLSDPEAHAEHMRIHHPGETSHLRAHTRMVTDHDHDMSGPMTRAASAGMVYRGFPLSIEADHLVERVRGRRTAGANGDLEAVGSLPSGIRFETAVMPDDLRQRQPIGGTVYAFLDGGNPEELKYPYLKDCVGILRWYSSGEIDSVWVHPDLRRQGLASDLLRRAREADPTVHHSDHLTDDGRAWSQRVGATFHPKDLHLRFRPFKETLGRAVTVHAVEAWIGPDEVGHLYWFPGDDVILEVEVSEEYRRRGIATKMLGAARVIEPGLRHSDMLSADGEAWMQAVGSRWTTTWHRGMTVMLNAKDERALSVLAALASGATNAARDRLIELMAGGTGYDPWTGNKNGPRSGAGGWWTTDESAAWTYASTASPMAAEDDDAIFASVIFHAEIDESIEAETDGSGHSWHHLEPGTPLTLTGVTATLPAPAQARLLLDLARSQGGWWDPMGMGDMDTWVNPGLTEPYEIEEHLYEWDLTMRTEASTVRYEYEPSRSEYGGLVRTTPRVVAYDGQREIGSLDWDVRDPSLFGTVRVHPAYRRRGIATALWEEAKKVNPDLDPTTSVFYTPDGRAFVDSLTRTAGPAGNMVPFGRFPLLAPERPLSAPRDVKVLRMAQGDIDRLHPGQQARVAQVLDDLRAGRARVEPKGRPPLVGSYTVRVTNSLRLGLYISEDQPGGDAHPDWVVYWVGAHNYEEAERRMRYNGSMERTARATTLYHLTDTVDFRLDPNYRPQNNTTWGGDLSPRIFLTPRVETWVNGYGYWRPWVVEFSVDPAIYDFEWATGGYGGEVEVRAENYDMLRITRVLPLDAWCRETYGEFGWVEMWEERTFDTREVIEIGSWSRPLNPPRGYRYPGDARRESASWQREYAERVERFRLQRGAGAYVGSKTAGAIDPALLAEIEFVVHRRGGGAGEIKAHHPDQRVAWAGTEREVSNGIGRISWHADGEIGTITVDGRFRRRGLATELLRRAREVNPDIHHSRRLTDMGRAWSQAVASRRTASVSRAADLPDVGPMPDDYWGSGGCGALALAFVTLFPEMKIAVEWGTGHDEGLVWHAVAYDPATRRGHDFTGTGAVDWMVGTFNGNVEMDVSPHQVADAMDVLRGWDPSEPWGQHLVYEAAMAIESHWGLWDGESALHTATEDIYYHGTSVPLAPGARIVPAQPLADPSTWDTSQPTRGPSARHNDPTVAYATSSMADAWWWAEHAWNSGRGTLPRVYQVRPLGPVHPDPNNEFEGDVVSPVGFEVVTEITEGDEAEFWKEGGRTSTLDSLNPTGGVFVDYDPQARATAPLGPNLTTLAETQGVDPQTPVRIYRGAPEHQRSIVPGDFVTTDERLARDYGGRVLSLDVTYGDLLDDRTEPGGEEYIYRPGLAREAARSRGLDYESAWGANEPTFTVVGNVASMIGGDWEGYAVLAREKMSYTDALDPMRFIDGLAAKARTDYNVTDRGATMMYLIASGRGGEARGGEHIYWVVGEMPVGGSRWQPSRVSINGQYGRRAEANPRFLNAVAYTRGEEARKWIGVNLAGVVVDESMFADLAQTVTVYRGISLHPDVDPLTASKGGGSDLGSSWTVSLDAAKAIAERGMAGFTGAQTLGDTYEIDPTTDNARRNYVPTVLRAEVTLLPPDQGGPAPYRPWTIDYASEAEIDIPRGTEINLNGILRASKNVRSRTEPHPEFGFYTETVTWSWNNSWRNVNIRRTAMPDAQGWWYHYGRDLARYEMGHYTHLGTREAAEKRHSGLHGEGNYRHDGTLMRAKIAPRSPLNSPSNPMSDHEANALLLWEEEQGIEGVMPGPENGGDTRHWAYNRGGTPMEIAAKYGYQGTWRHDAFFYVNDVEDPGSISVAVDPDCITDQGEAPPTNESVGEGQLLLWAAHHPTKE